MRRPSFVLRDRALHAPRRSRPEEEPAPGDDETPVADAEEPKQGGSVSGRSVPNVVAASVRLRSY